MSFLEQIAQALASHLTIIISSIIAIGALRATIDAYIAIAREKSKAIHKFTYTSAMGETITVDSSKPLEVVQLRGLISTCNAHPIQQFQAEKPFSKSSKEKYIA